MNKENTNSVITSVSDVLGGRSVMLFMLWGAAQFIGHREAQRLPPTPTPAETTDCKCTPEPENGKRHGSWLHRK